jgi:glucose uptake protein
VVWTSGNYAAFRASEAIGLARAAGSWTPLNIVVAFVWGAALFGELDHLSGVRLAVLGAALGLVVAGVLVIVRSQGGRPAGAPPPSARAVPDGQRSPISMGQAAHDVAAGPATRAAIAPPPPAASGQAAHAGEASQRRRGLLWAIAAGVLWGSYFVPAQWAGTSAQVSNFPLAVGMLAGGMALVLSRRAPVRPPVTGVAVNVAAGVLFGIGNLALLGLVSRVGTGVGFTIAQLSLLVNASIGIWVFKVPPRGSRSAKLVMAGILIAGSGGAIIGALR